MHRAACTNNLGEVSEALDGGCSLASRDASGRTALHLAIQHRQIEKVVDVLEVGQRYDDFDIDAQDDKGDTALHVAVALNFAAAVTALFKFHPSTSVQNENEQVVLQVTWSRKQCTTDEQRDARDQIRAKLYAAEDCVKSAEKR